MALMGEQPNSLAFRKRYPKFNGLIWAYHWMQVGLYEPLLVGRTAEERQADYLIWTDTVAIPPAGCPSGAAAAAAVMTSVAPTGRSHGLTSYENVPELSALR